MSNFDLEYIQTLLELLKKNEVNEFKLELESGKVWLRRGGAETHRVLPAPASVSASSGQTTSESALPALPSEYRGPEQRLAPEVKAGHSIKSPMVGTFYRRPAVDADPYVEVGDTVKKGDVLCIVEAMKLMNEIESDVSGKVVEVCLSDGQMAEYGEVLFRIEATTH